MFRIPDEEQCLTEAETAELLGFSVAKVRDLRRQGRLGSITMGRHIYHSGRHIRDYIRSCETVATAQAVSAAVSDSLQAPPGSSADSFQEAVRSAAQASARRTFQPPSVARRRGQK